LGQAERVEAIDLDDGVSIEVATAFVRAPRGYTVVAALCDELAFWSSENSANPDSEVLGALRPGTATIPDAMLVCASSPPARRGVLFDAYKRYFGRDGAPVLVRKAPTRLMNPSVARAVIDAAMERDPASASAEYLAEFRKDVESFVEREAVEACIALGVRERAPVAGLRYAAFVDPSGGSSDSMALAIGHQQGGVAILDALRECRAPFRPADVFDAFAALLARYQIAKDTGDRYGGEWPRERFREHGIAYELAVRPKSDFYRDLLPTINSRLAELLDDTRLVARLAGLERRVTRGGRDIVDCGPRHRDDLVNAVAGLVVELLRPFGSGYDSSLDWVSSATSATNRPSLWLHPTLQGRFHMR
jgi:hypothetical protein